MLLSYGTLRECGVKHALMREVAHLEWGNFRGVCPILNRAKELGDTTATCEAYGVAAMRVAAPDLR